MNQHGRTPRFVKLIAAGAVVGLLLVLVAAWEISNIREAEEHSDCERTVAARADQRVMWLWLGEQFPEPLAEVQLEAELNRQLPVLRCNDGDPMPVEEEP